MDYDELFKKLKADLKIAAQEYQKLLSVTIVFMTSSAAEQFIEDNSNLSNLARRPPLQAR